MQFIRKQMTKAMNMDKTGIRQLLKVFSDQDLALIGFVAVHKSGAVALSFLDHIDDETAAHIMAGLALNCERALAEVAERVPTNPGRRDPDLN